MRFSALGAPLFLIAGILLGTWAQPDTYDWRFEDISSLASVEARERWLMTVGFYGTGICHMLTAYGLRAARPAGRWMLALGGAAVLMVALFPEPPEGQGALHNTGAGIAFFALAVWPALAAGEAAWALRPRVAFSAAGTLLLLLAGFLLTLQGIGPLGIAERAVAVAEALWPLVVVESVRRHAA